ncbi:GGDEF domain-containing protein [Nakamurella sp. UYEF19]|uniref:GGDEF domain-containing protein n=1 Tax=Nakamurella sp. UYEF19 TaxID=1756392 RepID=UPI003392092F
MAVLEHSRINWHQVGAVGSLISQVIMGLAAVNVTPGLRTGGYVWYFATFGGIGLVYWVIRKRQSPLWWFVWPVLALARIIAFGYLDRPAAQLVTGLISVFFLFAGLTQPQGRSLLLLPLALVGLRGLIDLPLNLALVRLSIAAIVWAMASELPAYLLRGLAAQQEALAATAETDSLTGARNRRGLDELLHRLQGRAYLVIVDLDDFKHYNDTHGHLAGDDVLIDFTSMLHRESRREDIVIRYGGEEFLAVLQDVDQELAERIVARWAKAWHLHPSGITFSAGLTDLLGEDALRRADTALYAAKAAGRDRTVVSLAGAGQAA